MATDENGGLTRVSLAERLAHWHDIPLSNARQTAWWLRKTLFSRERSSGPSIRVEHSAEYMTRFLGRRYFEPGWESSYHYRGEVLNLRRVVYDEREVNGTEYRWFQLHVRGYRSHPSGADDSRQLELDPHYEVEPIEHPDAHASFETIDRQRAIDDLSALFERGGIEHTVVRDGHGKEIT